MTRHAREHIIYAVIQALRAIPAFEGRVYREDDPAWNEESYPAAVIVTGRTAIREISGNDGYQLQGRSTAFDVAIGVREHAGEDPVDELSAILVVVEDALAALEDEPIFDAVTPTEIGTLERVKDTKGYILATVLGCVADYYTQKHGAGEIVVG